jgi:transposase-like protein
MSTLRQDSTLFDTLPPLQAEVASALASGATISAAASQAGVHRSTLHNWLKQQAFKDALDQARNYYAESVRDQLAELSALALDTIRQILSNPEAPASVRLRAAMAVLERPQFPDRGWSLPVPAYYPESEQKIVDTMASLEVGSRSVPTGNTVAQAPRSSPSPGTPRNAPCPCGSGTKYKRCCGRSAPPALAA